MKWKIALAGLLAAAVFSQTPKAQRRNEISVVRVPHGGIQPQAVVEHGTLHLLYFSGDAKAGDLYYVKSGDWGASWSVPLRVNSVSGSALALGTIRGGQLAVGRNGRVHVAWNGSSITESTGPMNPEAGKRGAPMLYSRLNDAGNAFEPERNLMTRTFGLDGGGTLAADNAGDVYVAWHGKAPGAGAGEAGREVWVAVSRDEGKSFGAERSAWGVPTGACGCCGMALFADATGVVRVLYRSATENVHRDMYLLESRDHGQNFEGRKLQTWDINACPMSSMDFAEGRGGVVGSWQTGGQVYWERFNNGQGAAVGAPGEGKGRKHSRVAVGRDGEVLMVWTEGTGWQKGGSLAWQLYDGAGKAVGDRESVDGVPTWSFGAVVAKPDGFVVLY